MVQTYAPSEGTIIESIAYRNAVDEEIRELWCYRQWYRRQLNAAHWSPLRIENDIKLRALVHVARKARALSRPLVERQDPLTLAKGDHFVGVGR